MPFKSEAQRRKFYAMADRGEMPKSKVEEYERATKGDIPERVGNRDFKREYEKRRSIKQDAEKREMKREAKRKARKKLMRAEQREARQEARQEDRQEARSGAPVADTASNA